jgi:hypothetical protein
VSTASNKPLLSTPAQSPHTVHAYPSSSSLQVTGGQMCVWFYANGAAGYSFYIEYAASSSGTGFSWSITVRCGAAWGAALLWPQCSLLHLRPRR